MQQESRSDAAETAEQLATVLWNPELHRQVSHEQLAFVSVGFRPRYQRVAALQVIDRAFAQVGVRSYVVWELQRKPDLLLKVWVPAGKNPDDVEGALRGQASQQPHLHLELDVATFQVTTMLSHHLWPHTLTSADIDDALHRGGDFLASGTVSGPLPADLSELERRRVIAPINVDVSGIKFFIWIALAELRTNERARSTLEAELVRTVSSTRYVYATSVYRGTGSDANYVVTGRFKPEHYEVLARELQPKIGALGEPFIATNTDTALSTLFGPIDRVEALLLATDEVLDAGPKSIPLPTDLAQLLTQEESALLEFKGSAFNTIGDEGVANDSAKANRNKTVRDAIVKSCAGFLNGGGGVLVIGVVEADRVPLDVAREYRAEAEQAGNYLVVGVDRTIDGRRLSWDAFERRLRQLIGDAISPPPEPWMDIVRLPWGDLDVAAVVLQEPNTWHWAKTSSENDVFYARYGNTTRPLRGQAQHGHMKSRQRD